VTARERQPRNSDRAHYSAGGRESVRVRLVVEVAPGRARLSAGGAAGRIYAHTFGGRQIDHEAALADCETRNAVSSSPYGHQKAVGARESHAFDNVGCTSAADNDRRLAVNHAVVDFAQFVIGRVFRPHDRTSH
jgi:hypothetical protein